MNKLYLVAFLVCALGAHAETTDRLARRVVAPREAIDLQCAWTFGNVPSAQAGVVTNGQGKTTQLWTPRKYDETTKWERKDIPLTDSLGAANRSNWARRTFDVPEALAGKRATLKFELISDTFTVYVNDRAYQQDTPVYGVPYELDVTDALKRGANTLEIHFYYTPLDNHYYLSNRGDQRGVQGPVQIEFTDAVYIDDVFVKTFVVNGRKIVTDVTVKNTSSDAVQLALSGTVCELGGAKAVSLAAGGEFEVGANASKTVTLETAWLEAHLWNPDDPHLYYLDVALANGKRFGVKTRDALRTRFGFREFEIRKHRFYLNGYPFIGRSGWLIDGTNHADRLQWASQFKKRGNNAARLFLHGSVSEQMDVADEAGLLLMVNGQDNNGGAGWAERQNDRFWGEYDKATLAMVKAFRNHPSILIWSLGCEFGAIYCGEGSEREQMISDRICGTGRRVMAADPTRTWCECGGVEVGCPVKGPGPCPTRSFHYPVGLNTDVHCFPDCAYWYPDGVVSWQRVADFEKPTVITEDLYHGMQDSHLGMARFFDDAIYTTEGYRDALRYAFNMFCEGYYCGGLAWWEPWMPFTGNRYNLLYGDWEEPALKNDFKGVLKDPEWQVMPEWLVAMRPFRSTLEGGTAEERTLYAYNETFTPRDVTLVREDFLGTNLLSRTEESFAMTPGMKWEKTISIEPSEVDKTGKFTMQVSLLDAGDKTVLTSRKWDWTVFPKAWSFGSAGRLGILAETNSPLSALSVPCGVSTNIAELLRKNPAQVIVAKKLVPSEGKRLNDFVMNGGRVLLLEVPAGGWVPQTYWYGKPVRMVWRRSFTAMTDFPVEALQSWRPDGMVSTSAIPKSGKEDMMTLFDCGFPDGLSGAEVAWLYRGKGAWLLCQIPVLSAWEVEPAAKPFFNALVAELAGSRTLRLDKTFATWKCDSTNGYYTVDRDIYGYHTEAFRSVTTTGSSYDFLLEKSGILRDTSFTNVLDEAPVILMDGSQGLTDEIWEALNRATARKDVTVFIPELPEDTDPARLAKLGLALEVNRDWPRDENGRYMPDCNPHPMGDYPHWVVPAKTPSVLSGLSADDFLWHPQNNLWSWGRYTLTHTFPGMRVPHDTSLVTSELVALSHGPAKVLTEPGAVAVVPWNKGRIVLSTLRFRSFYERHTRRVSFVLRTILNNLGCHTSVAEKVYEPTPLDIHEAMNNNLWNDPKYRKDDGTFKPVGWFGTENDMRYFPVNLCGWSTTANNFCPKGVFPTEPVNLGGKAFLLQDPEKNGGKAIIVLQNDEDKTIRLAKPVRMAHAFFLGAAEQWHGAVEIKFNGVSAPEIYTTAEHFNGFRFASTKTKGVTAWVGETPKDATAGLWFWQVANPKPDVPVSEITIKNVTDKPNCGVAILAITSEKEAE